MPNDKLRLLLRFLVVLETTLPSYYTQTQIIGGVKKRYAWVGGRTHNPRLVNALLLHSCIASKAENDLLVPNGPVDARAMMAKCPKWVLSLTSRRPRILNEVIPAFKEAYIKYGRIPDSVMAEGPGKMPKEDHEKALDPAELAETTELQIFPALHMDGALCMNHDNTLARLSGHQEQERRRVAKVRSSPL